MDIFLEVILQYFEVLPSLTSDGWVYSHLDHFLGSSDVDIADRKSRFLGI